MEIIGNNKKRSIAQKMRISPHILAILAHKGGKIGRIASKIDSLQSRILDRGHGVYKTR